VRKSNNKVYALKKVKIQGLSEKEKENALNEVRILASIKKPNVISYLAEKNDLVEEVLINTLTDWGRESNTRKREIAVDVGKYIHDKIHGKATQQIETTNKSVTISIDLTGDGEAT
jgi:serine/threonine protein kinase